MTPRNNPHPCIAFCSTNKGRLSHVVRTLPKNIADNTDYPNCIFILLMYNDPSPISITDDRLVVYRFNDDTDKFRMAHAKNLAHRCGMLEGADILVNLDADNYTGHGFSSYLVNEFQRDGRMCMWSRMIKEGPDKLTRGITGRIAVTVNGFLAAGGYDESYEHWSPDDADFTARLQRINYRPYETDKRYLLAIPHNNKIRFREYQHVRVYADYDHSCEVMESDDTVVNYGQIGCGTVYRNDDPTPITIGPLPTRIFGIGLHKTATSSLNAALNLLGFDSSHWESPQVAKTIWLEIQSLGRSQTLEQHYCKCDLPIPIIFRELDRAYP